MLDTDFEDGRRFLSVWLAWQRDPHRSRMLHYVGIAPTPPSFMPHNAPPNGSGPLGGAHALAEQCRGIAAGFHRMLLDNARVSLTLCVGDVQSMLGEHAFQADTVFAREPADKWTIQLLARRCKRGARFRMLPVSQAGVLAAPDPQVPILLQAAGFALDQPSLGEHVITGRFDPRWEIATSRNPIRQQAPAPARCAVIGAGIAGASVAHALALRGWQVSVFDQESTPAGGASGLPAGLAVPHVSADDNPRARLSRSGARLLSQHAQRKLVCGQDWEPTGVMERRPDGTSLWHAQACWIKPARLVQAWLDQPGIRFTGLAQVARLVRAGDLWQLFDSQDRALGEFEVVVVANALASAALLQGMQSTVPMAPDVQAKLAALHAVHGTLSHGTYAEVLPGLPPTPLNGNGCFIPHVPGPRGDQWFAGSTFEIDPWAAADAGAQHASNMQRLAHLLPVNGIELAAALERGPTAQWSATRCVTHDRLPLVGPIESAGDGLWLCVGMGSRGLSFSSLCAELLVARLGAEPLPVEFSLSRSLDVNRVRRRQSAGTGV